MGPDQQTAADRDVRWSIVGQMRRRRRHGRRHCGEVDTSDQVEVRQRRMSCCRCSRESPSLDSRCLETHIRVLVIDLVAGAIIRLVASLCVCVRSTVGTLLFEPFDL